MSVRINIGCGQTPTPGWRNYDNSWSVRLARSPLLARLLGSAGLLTKAQQEFVDFAQRGDILWANAVARIPESDASADVLYSSHMLEHLTRDDALSFLAEARRVLKSGGVIRIAVPDIRILIDDYLEDEDADRFVERTLLTRMPPRTAMAKTKYLVIGDRNHQWMYDGRSLCRLLTDSGLRSAQVAQPGTTRIADSGGLDLEQRVLQSVFVEAINP